MQNNLAGVRPPESQSRPTRAENAYVLLRAEILHGRLAPGEKLKIDDLQTAFAFSNSPLREALNRLAAEGLVVADGRRGFRVSPISVEDFSDLTEFRLVLECSALEAAIELGGDDWESEVVAAAYRLDVAEGRLRSKKPEHGDAWTERHKAFHMSLLSGCGVPRLLQTCSEMYDQAERYRRLSSKMRVKPRDGRVEHENLAKLTAARDPAAVELLREHISQTAKNVATILGR